MLELTEKWFFLISKGKRLPSALIFYILENVKKADVNSNSRKEPHRIAYVNNFFKENYCVRYVDYV